MPIRLVAAPITLDEVRTAAAEEFGDFIKAVVDVGRGVMAMGGELHADEEALLLAHARPTSGGSMSTRTASAMIVSNSMQ